MGEDTDKLLQSLARLERIMEAGFGTLADLIRETNQRVSGLEDRFDNFLTIAGGETRTLHSEVNDLRSRLERLERRFDTTN